MSRGTSAVRVKDAGYRERSNTNDDLPDINVWVALAIKEHPHHAAAVSYWSHQSNARVWFCRVTMLGLVRLLTQQAVAQQAVMTLGEAMGFYAELLALTNIPGVASEPPEIEARLGQLIDLNLPAKYLTDAYLAAFAVCSGMRFVTFDKDFERFKGLNLLRLTP